MAEKFYPYDSAKYLETEEDIADYMEAVMEEAGDDAGFVAHALGIVARARNMSQLARDAGITREGLYKAFSADGNPSFATVAKVAGALGLRVSFKPAKRDAGAKRVASANPRRPAKSDKNGKRATEAKPGNAASPASATKRRNVA